MSILANNLLRWGQLPFKRSLAKCEIKFSDKGCLDSSDLKLLLNKKIDVLVIEGFLRYEMLSHTQARTAGFHKGDLSLNPDSTRYGFACEDTYNHKTLKHFYDKSSVNTIAKHREEMFPYMTWFDKLRAELDEAHPDGAILGHSHGVKKAPFISRAYEHDRMSLVETRSLPPHMDYVDKKMQLIAMQFLVTPPKGGALELYKDALSRDEHNPVYLKNLSVLPNTLSPAKDVIKPFSGRFVLFNAELPFKFSQVETEEIIINKEKDEKKINMIPLVVLESFIISHGDNKPLTLMR